MRRDFVGMGVCRLFWLIAVGLVAGCEMPTSSRFTTLQFMTTGSVENQKIEETVIAEFEKENPDIKVNLVCVNSRYPDKIQTMMVGDVAPDLFFVGQLQYDDWARRGTLMDLTEVVQGLTQDLTLMPVARRASERDGKYYSIPINCHGWVMYCNFDALEAAGITLPKDVTWDYLLEIAPRLASKRGEPGAPTPYAIFVPPAPILLWAFGGKLFDDPVAPTKVVVNSPETRHAVDYLRLLHKTGCVIDAMGDQGSVEVFRDGKVAFYFSGRWTVPQLIGKTKFKWDILRIPSGPGGCMTLHGYTGLAVSNRTQHPEAARRFARFYASRNGVQLLVTGGSTVPVFKEMARSPEFMALNPPASNYQFVDTMEEGNSSLLFYGPGASEVTSIFSGRLQQAVAMDRMPTAEIVAGMESDLNRWLKRQKEAGLIKGM